MYHVLVAVSENGDLEAAAVRSFLENLGCTVTQKYVGRPMDFVSILEGRMPFSPDVIIFCGHGEDGAFLMPVLARQVYLPGEPENIAPCDISEHLRICPKLFISTACTTGTAEIGEIFRGQGTVYLAPEDYIDGRDMLFWVCGFFFRHIVMGENITEACENAKVTDEQKQIRLYCAQ